MMPVSHYSPGGPALLLHPVLGTAPIGSALRSDQPGCLIDLNRLDNNARRYTLQQLAAALRGNQWQHIERWDLRAAGALADPNVKTAVVAWLNAVRSHAPARTIVDLDLSGNGLTDEDIHPLLGQPLRIGKLQLRDNQLSLSGFSELCILLKDLRPEYLDVSGNRIVMRTFVEQYDTETRNFLQARARRQSQSTVNFGLAPQAHTALRGMTDRLDRTPRPWVSSTADRSLVGLIVNGLHHQPATIADNDRREFEGCIVNLSASGVTRLRLNGNPLLSDVADPIALEKDLKLSDCLKTLARCVDLLGLELSGCRVTHAAAYRLLESWADGQLKDLNLSRINLEPPAAAALVVALDYALQKKPYKALNGSLNLSHNQLGDEGVKAVLEALVKWPSNSACRIDLHDNGLRQASIDAITTALTKSPNLSIGLISTDELAANQASALNLVEQFGERVIYRP